LCFSGFSARETVRCVDQVAGRASDHMQQPMKPAVDEGSSLLLNKGGSPPILVMAPHAKVGRQVR